MEIWLLMIITFVLTFVFLFFLIRFQTIKKIGQTEREEGLETHKKKNNTPIFGGIAFVVSFFIVLTSLLIIEEINLYHYLLLVFPMLSYSVLGLIDDLLILRHKKNTGVRPNIKFLFQILIAIIYFIIYLIFNFDTTIDLGFTVINLKFLYGMFILFSFSGFTNALNITDGIDGLLAGTLSFILIGVYVISNDVKIHQILAIFFAGLCSFLYFNLPKAKIFMGDTGSLALGSIFVSIFIILKLEIFMFIFGLVYCVETLSVILQVLYFKITKGKRIFKMAPIHHHFEIVFNSEIKTLVLMYAFTILTVVLGVFLYIKF